MATETTVPPPAAMTFRQVLGLTVMRRVWYAQVVSLFGDFLALFAVLSVVTYRMRGTPTQVTGVSIAYMAPIVVLGPLSGVFVDRWPIKPTLVSSDLIRAALVLLLFAAGSLWQIYVILAALSCVSSFFAPAQSVTIRTHVPPQGLISANALMQMAMLIARIIGPAAAGMLVAAFGAAVCYAVDLVSFLASAALIGSVAIQRPPSADASRGAPAGGGPKGTGAKRRIRALIEDMREGGSFIFHHAAVSFVVMAMAAGMFVIGCFGPLIAIWVREALHASAFVFGVVSAMVGVGMMFGMPAVRRISGRVSNATLVLSGLAGIGVGALLLGALPWAVASAFACFTLGFTFAGVIVPAQTLLQRETPHALMGRISSTSMSVIFFGQLAGLILSGVLAQRLGVRAVFFLCAVLAWILTGAGSLLLRTERHAQAL
ncbi:MAG TPA: MFS transporter [Vicinamibacterales bacterium]|nr:MFS transporter [Vicinamibacterales bacterium]